MNEKRDCVAVILSALLVSAMPILAADSKPPALTVTSTAFSEGQPIPEKYTCDGANLSPPLAWSAAPPNTRTLALICEDPDAPMRTFTHWIACGMPGSVKELPEGVPAAETLPGGGTQGKNDFKRTGYGGPCPPPGKAHRYYFKLYTLDADVKFPRHGTKKELLSAMEKHILAEGSLMGTYQRKR